MAIAQTGGGAATHAGTSYQNRVAAWLSVQILAESDTSLPWNLPTSTTLDFIRCETLEPVDDLLVGTSQSGHIFLQAKHAIDCGSTDNSEFASVVDQFVRQFHIHSVVGPNSSWDRPLENGKDRLVLVTDSTASNKIRVVLPKILERIRSLTPSQAVSAAAVNQNEQAVLKILQEHASRSWRLLKQVDPSDSEFRALAQLITVLVLDADPGQAHEREAKTMLRTSVIRNASQTDQAWTLLLDACASYAANRTGASRSHLQNVLLSGGVDVNPTRSFRADIQRLSQLSHATLQAFGSLSEIRITDTQTIKVARHSTDALKTAALAGSLVVVGQPGAGKSGALFDLANQLQPSGDVLFLAVGQFEAGSLGALRSEIGCDHDIVDVLTNWPSIRPGFLLIDALDAARTENGIKTFRELIGQILAHGGRWHVVPSIRKFDLRYSHSLHNLFRGTPPCIHTDPEFPTIRHLDVPVFTDDELDQVKRQSTELGSVISNASSDLLRLIRVPFNLRLVAELVGVGVSISSFTPIRTQIELLERYWRERVASDVHADAREAVLRLATDEMIRRRTLRINRGAITKDPSTSVPLHQILSAQVLTEWQPSPDIPPDQYVITFAHHILFDYAVARLNFRGPADEVVAWLETEPDLLLAIRPSLQMHYQFLWNQDPTRLRFWEFVVKIDNSRKIPSTGKILGPLVASQLIASLRDTSPLLALLKNESHVDYKSAVEAFRHLMSAVHSSQDSFRPIVGSDAPPWCELLREVSEI